MLKKISIARKRKKQNNSALRLLLTKPGCAAVILLVMALLFAFPAPAQNPSLDYTSFRSIPILHEGRVKPLDSYARARLKQISGTDRHADIWLAETLFDPASAIQKPVFLIASADIRSRLGLEQNRKYFTLPEVQAGVEKPEILSILKTDPENLSAEQRQILTLGENIVIFNQMLRSFSHILPLDIPGQKEPLSYLQLTRQNPRLLRNVKNLIDKKGIDIGRYSESEKELAQLAFVLQQIRAGGEANNELKVIATNGTWLSPWESNAAIPLSRWAEAAKAYRDQDPAAWNNAIEKIIESAGPHKNFRLEILYNTYKPFHAALLLYALAFVLFLLPGSRQLWIERTSLLLGLCAHGCGILARILILARPPVGTLYEAILFVSFICALFGLGRKSPAAHLSGLSASILLLTIAPAFLQNGDSMEMLVAVLNTNFWLSTHVLCITIGYALSIITACIAHIYLLAHASDKPEPLLSVLKNNIYIFSVAALLLTAVGTALGGIWADQSWGRFWGWDPKENGALLIVLWLIWLHHGRLSHKITPVAFAAGMAFINVVVALAWFGVNLLSVGLHSYGFTSGIAWGLGLFCAAETAIIGWLWLTIHRRHHAA